MMKQTAYFGGRVTVRTLPFYDGMPPLGVSVLKRAILPQGAIAQIHQGAEGMHYIAWVEFKAGGVRANHVHAKKKENLYVVAGEIDAILVDESNGERVEVRLVAGDVMFVSPGIAHAVRTVVPGHGIEFSPDPLTSDDTFPRSLLGVPGSVAGSGSAEVSTRGSDAVHKAP